jgi:hypothetical protein
MSLKGRARWAIRDGRKFRNFITDIRCLIDGQESLAAPLRQSKLGSLDEHVNIQMAKISDPLTLSLIEEAASQSHPDLSETVSVKLGALRRSRGTSDCNLDQNADNAVEIWIKKQSDLVEAGSRKTHFVSCKGCAFIHALRR